MQPHATCTRLIQKSGFVNYSISTNKNDYLSNYSDRDKKWDNHANNRDALSCRLFDIGNDRGNNELLKYSEKIDSCALTLQYKPQTNMQTGEVTIKLKKAFFCKKRTCPLCSWRRSMKNFWLIFTRIKEAVEKDKLVPLFLTLTVPNVEVDNLRDKSKDMTRAWNNLMKRKELKSIKGWVKTTEITYSQKYKNAHPHFHVILLVSSTYFKGDEYIKRDRWLQLWQQATNDPSITQVDIRRVKPRIENIDGKKVLDIYNNGTLPTNDGLMNAVLEVSKYATKSSDLLACDDNFLVGYINQIKGLRFIATGGALKDAMKEEHDNLINLNDDEDEDGEEEDDLITFNYIRPIHKYKRSRPTVSVSP